jgi:hypothetical protein
VGIQAIVGTQFCSKNIPDHIGAIITKDGIMTSDYISATMSFVM